MPETFEAFLARVKASAFIGDYPRKETVMAKVIEEQVQFSKTSSGGFGRRYDWDTWLELSEKPNFAVMDGDKEVMVRSGKTLQLDQSKGELETEGPNGEPLPRSKQSVKDGTVTEQNDFETSVDLIINRLRVRGWKDYLVCMVSKVDAKSKKLPPGSIIIKYREMTPSERVAEDERREEAKVRAKVRQAEASKNGEKKDVTTSNPPTKPQPATTHAPKHEPAKKK